MRAQRNPDGARGRRPQGHDIWICTAIVISSVSILLGVNVNNLCNQALVPKEYEYNIDMPVLPAVTNRREETTRAGSAVEQFTIYGHSPPDENGRNKHQWGARVKVRQCLRQQGEQLRHVPVQPAGAPDGRQTSPTRGWRAGSIPRRTSTCVATAGNPERR